MDNTSVKEPYSPDAFVQLSFLHKATAILMYTTMSLVAICGNTLIVIAIVNFSRLRTATNILILNLAVADLMISVLCMPFSYWHVIIFADQRWIFGATLCKLFAFMQATAVFLSSWTLVAISFDRFTAIMFVMSPWLRLTKRRSLYLVLITWSFATIMAAPLFIVNHTDDRDRVVTCGEYGWHRLEKIFGEGTISTYGTAVFALQYCLPLIVLIITYAAIGFRIWNSDVPGSVSSRGVLKDRHGSVRKVEQFLVI